MRELIQIDTTNISDGDIVIYDSKRKCFTPISKAYFVQNILQDIKSEDDKIVELNKQLKTELDNQQAINEKLVNYIKILKEAQQITNSKEN